jgi:hypothetical protein
MRTILWLTVAVLALMVAGVVTFDRSRGEITMHLYTHTLERDAREVVNASQHLLNKAEQILDRSGRSRPGHDGVTNTKSAKS